MTMTDSIPADPTDPAWHEARRSFIGASDAPAVLGISPWSTPLDVWADKLGIAGQFQGNLATDMGHALEELIAREWCEANDELVVDPKVTVRHHEHPHIAASVDREVLRVSFDDEPDTGPRDLLECKYVGPTTAWQWKHGVPVYVQAQVQVQMAVTGAQRCHVAALIVDYAPSFFSQTIERDDDAIDDIIGRLNQFWTENVEGQERPELDAAWNAEKVREALGRIYAQPTDEEPCRLTVAETELIATIKHAKALRKDLDGQIEQAENELRAALGNATAGYVDDNEKPAVTWKPQKRTTYDTKAVLSRKVDGFTDEQIDIAIDVLHAVEQTSTTRVLRIA